MEHTVVVINKKGQHYGRDGFQDLADIDDELAQRGNQRVILDLSLNRLIGSDVPKLVEWLQTYPDLWIDVSGNNIGMGLYEELAHANLLSCVMLGRISTAPTRDHRAAEVHIAQQMELLVSSVRTVSTKVAEAMDLVKGTSRTVNKLAGVVGDVKNWQKKADKSLEVEATSLLLSGIEGLESPEDYSLIRRLEGTDGNMVVEFDGAVLAELKGQKVLVLLEAKHHMKPLHINLKACTSDREKHECLPSRIDRYKQFVAGLPQLIDSGNKWVTQTLPKSLLARLHDEKIEILAAIASNYFDDGIIAYAHKKKYICLKHNGKRFHVVKGCPHFKPRDV